MESLRRPEMIISVASVTGLLGSIIFFYRKSNALQAELEKLAEHLAGTARKVGELQTQSRDISQLVEAIKQLNGLVSQHSTTLREVKDSLDPLNEEMEDFSFVIDNLVEAFKDQGVEIKRERRRGRRGKKSKRRVESESSSSEESPPPRRRRKGKEKKKKIKAKEESEESEESDADITAAIAASRRQKSR